MGPAHALLLLPRTMHCTLPARVSRARAATAIRATAIRATAIAAALAAALTLAAAPARAQTARDNAAQMERPEVREVRIRGTKALARGDVAAALATKASGCLSLAFTPFCLFTKSPYVYERRYLDQAEFERDVVRLLVFYYKRGYRDTQVDTTVARAGRRAVRVTFTVREGPPTRTATLAVDDSTGTLPASRAAGLLAPKPGQPFNTLRLDSAVVRVRDFYWDRGYGNAVIGRPAVAVDDSADTASARIPVRRGPLTPISRIDIVRTGAQHAVRDASIRNTLGLAPGDLFRRTQVARAQRALYETGLFRSALIDTAVATQGGNGQTVCASQGTRNTRPAPAAAAAAAAAAGVGPGAPDSTKALVVCVAEAPLQEARTSAGFTTADFVQVEGRYTHNYFLGGSRRVNVQATLGNLGSRQFSSALPTAFNNPFRNTNIPGRREDRFFLPTYLVGVDVQQRDLGSARNTLGVGVFASRRSSPGVFVDQGQGANATFTRRFGERTPVSLAYQFELNRVQAGDVYFCVNFGVCDVGTIAAVSSARRLAPLALTASTGRVDDPLSPTRGVLARATVQHASAATFSQFRFNRVDAQVSYYRPAPFFPRVTLATRLRGGFVRALGGATGTAAGVGGTSFELLHPRTRFYAGGSQSVRGYGENQLGPRVLTIAPDVIRGRSIRGRDTTYAVRPDTLGGSPACALDDPVSLRVCFASRQAFIGDGSFNPRPLGGTALVEANLEARFPIYGQFVGAVFVDAGVLGERSFRDLTAGTRTVTPGFGVRYRSPVGPVRVDVGIRPNAAEPLPVITQRTDSAGRNTLFDLTSGNSCTAASSAAYCRLYPSDPQTGLSGLARRLVLHLSIGEAF